MKLSEMLPSGSQYLRAEDLPVRSELNLAVDKVQVEEIDDGDGKREAKPVLHFKDKEKGLILNKTNAQILISGYGDETDTYPGKPVVLYRTETQFQGRTVPCLRLRVPAPQADEATPDDIPF